jgi:hypothetical protein
MLRILCIGREAQKSKPLTVSLDRLVQRTLWRRDRRVPFIQQSSEGWQNRRARTCCITAAGRTKLGLETEKCTLQLEEKACS